MSDADVMIQNLHHLCLLMRFPRTIETPIFHRKRYQVVFCAEDIWIIYIHMHNYIVPYSSRIYDSDIAFAWIWGANPLWLWYSSTKYAECFQIRMLCVFSTSSVLRFWQARQQVNSIIFWCKRGTTSKAHVRGNPPRQIFVAGRRIPKLKWGHFWKILREVKVTTNLPEMNFNYWGSNCNSSDLHLPTHATWKHTWKAINC